MDYPPILDLESSTFLPRERRKRAKLLSNEAYTLTRVGCQRRKAILKSIHLGSTRIPS